MINWFPLPRHLMESPTFILLTPLEKLYLLHVASEINLRGPFYQADLEVAVTLGASEDKIRRVRRQLVRIGWVMAQSGFQSRGRNLATRYLDVPVGKLADGDFFAPLHRFALQSLLDRVRHKLLSHADLVVYVYLCYFRHRVQGDRSDFFITKQELRDLTGLAAATGCVEHLYRDFIFAGGSHLFEYSDEYHRLRFLSWAGFADPSEDEANAKRAQTLRQEIADRVQALRHPECRQPARRGRASARR